MSEAQRGERKRTTNTPSTSQGLGYGLRSAGATDAAAPAEKPLDGTPAGVAEAAASAEEEAAAEEAARLSSRHAVRGRVCRAGVSVDVEGGGAARRTDSAASGACSEQRSSCCARHSWALRITTGTAN